MSFALHRVLKNSACVTKNPKKVDLSRYVRDWEKGLKILRLPPNAGELTAMKWAHTVSAQKIISSGFKQSIGYVFPQMFLLWNQIQW